MGVLKVSINDKLLKAFREEAMRKYGYVRGALSIAAKEAIEEWLKKKNKRKSEIEDFKRALERVAGIWRGKDGKSYVRKIRRDWERRSKRLGV